MSSLKRNEKITRKNVEHKLEEAFSDSIRADVQRRRFILLHFPISQQLPGLTSLNFFSFPKWPLKLNCTFCWQQSGGSEQLTNSESWKLFSYKCKVTKHPSCALHPSYLPISLRSFYLKSRLYDFDR